MRILVVEDEPALGAQLVRAIGAAGHTVDSAADGATAHYLGEVEDFDAVVLDLGLPKLDGLSVLRRWRAAGRNMPVLILTARGAWHEKVAGIDAGADDYLAKPFSFQELLARLRAITRRPAVEPRTVLSAADLELDTVRHEVRRAGRPIELSAKEFALLELLLRKKGAVVTRSMILDRIWDLDYDGGSNLVEVYINYLRRKVDQDFEPKLIQTVRGSGYVLRETV